MRCYIRTVNHVGGAQERRRRRVLRTNGNAGAVREGFVNGMDNSTVWFLVLPLYVLMLAEKITGKDKDNEQY